VAKKGTFGMKTLKHARTAGRKTCESILKRDDSSASYLREFLAGFFDVMNERSPSSYVTFYLKLLNQFMVRDVEPLRKIG
jgi:hypothetical protein